MYFLALVNLIATVGSCGRMLYRRITHRTTEVILVNDTTIVTPARDAFRDVRRRQEITNVLNRVIEEGAKSLVIDLSHIEPGFDDDQPFMPIASTYAQLRKSGSGDMVLVSPTKAVKQSFEFQGVELIAKMVESRAEAIECLASRRR